MSVNSKRSDCDIYELLDNLTREAQGERLECAVSLLDALREALSRDRAPGTPPGFLTVHGWMGLLTQWDDIMKAKSNRHIHYTRSFFQEIQQRPIHETPPMAPLLTELVSLMDNLMGILDSKAAA